MNYECILSTATDLVLICESVTSATALDNCLTNEECRMTAHGSLSRIRSSLMLRPTVKPASLSWNEAPIWSLWPDLYFSQTAAGLLMWSALSDETKGLSFTTAAGPRQRSHCWVRVSWDSWQYFIVSNSRRPFLSPPTSRRALTRMNLTNFFITSAKK
jgi:hypothetical protein